MATFLLRLPDDELEALRRAAEDARRSMNEMARDGIRQLIDGGNREDRIREIGRRIVARDAAVLERLADL